MAIGTLDELFDALLQAKSTKAVRDILDAIGDRPDLDPDQTFGSLGLRWHAFGDTLSNISSVGLGTKPGRSLSERLTNAMDAILEASVPSAATPLPDSCRLAAQQWFGRPISGPDSGLFQWRYDEGGYDRLIHVVLVSSDVETSPTIDVLDKGVGISPEQFPDTILSLQGGNKLSKRYLIGAFGQGGAATLAFADYVIVLSRSKTAPERIGFTVIKVLSLGELFKEDAYGYLAVKGAGGKPAAPSVVRKGPIELYPADTGLKRTPAFEYGTVVRHVAYQLTNLLGSFQATEGNLYHYVQSALFDPLLPFRILDLRHQGKAKDEIVRGSRNRLMGRVLKKQAEDSPDDQEGLIELRYYRPMEFVKPLGSTNPSLGVELWVVYGHRKVKDKVVLRGHSNELYLTRGHPIIGTMNGQNQGELTSKLLRDLGLGMVAKHIIVHVDASRCESTVRRQLFSTNREGFKEGPILKELEAALATILGEDKELGKIEKELTERFTRRETDETSKAVKDQIRQLLAEHGLQVADDATGAVPGDGEVQVVKEHKRRPHVPAPPLPTLPFPDVTRFVIVSPKPGMTVRLGDHETVLVETDADAEFDRQGRVAIRTEPPLLEEFGKAPLRGGRIRWRLRPRAETPIGATGSVVVSITMPDGVQITDSVPFEVLAPRQEPAKRDKTKIPPFEILPVSPDDYEKWSDLWPDLCEDDVADD